MMLVWKETKLLLRANKLRLSLWMESRLSLNRPTLSRIGFSGRSRVRRQAAAKHNDTTELPPEKNFTRRTCTFRYDLYCRLESFMQSEIEGASPERNIGALNLKLKMGTTRDVYCAHFEFSHPVPFSS